MNLRLSGQANGSAGVAQRGSATHQSGKSWEVTGGAAAQAVHHASLRTNGSRTNMHQNSVGSHSNAGATHNNKPGYVSSAQATALQKYEQKIMQTKQQLAAEAPLAIGSPQKTSH